MQTEMKCQISEGMMIFHGRFLTVDRQTIALYHYKR